MTNYSAEYYQKLHKEHPSNSTFDSRISLPVKEDYTGLAWFECNIVTPATGHMQIDIIVTKETAGILTELIKVVENTEDKDKINPYEIMADIFGLLAEDVPRRRRWEKAKNND